MTATAPEQHDLAVENARLRAEQAAMVEVLRAISESRDLPAVLHAIARHAVLLCDADSAVVYRLLGSGGSADTDDPNESRSLTAQVHRAAGWIRGDDAPVDRFIGPRTGSLSRRTPWGRAILERRPVHIPDATLLVPDEDYDASWLRTTTSPQIDTRSYLVVPMLSADAPVGALAVRRAAAPRPFSDQELALLQTFAAHAAVAIENARLFAELEESNATLTEKTAQLEEALAQQTATSDVLRVISESPTNVQPVLDAVAERTAVLCGARDVLVSLREGDHLHTVSHRVGDATIPSRVGLRVPLSVGRGNIVVRTVLDARTVHVPDMHAAAGEFPISVRSALTFGTRTYLCVPLLRAGSAIGAVLVRRAEVRPFTERQTALLQSFADQAVIAIENSRLFNELERRLAEQTATADVLRVIASSPSDLEAVLGTIAEQVVGLCGADNVVVYDVRDDACVGRLHWQGGTWHGMETTPVPVATPGSPITEAVRERRTVHVPDLFGPEGAAYTVTRAAVEASRAKTGREVGEGYTLAAVPLAQGERVIGVIRVRRVPARPFTDSELRLLETFADQAAVAIQNAKLFQELQQTNVTLKEALEQQTATAEVLRAIATSPGQIQAVLDGIAERAAHLLATTDALIWRRDTDSLRLAARGGRSERSVGSVLPLDESNAVGRAALLRRAVHVPDLRAAGDEFSARWLAGIDQRIGSLVAVPLLRDEAEGVLVLRRAGVQPFAEREIAVAESFASQAVVAIENARLFAALQERDERRRQELERASAIQQRLLPERVDGWPGVLEVAVRFRPAVETSGDFYAVPALPAARKGALEPLQIAVGDVAGKGMSAALVTALARSALRSTAAIPVQMATPANTLRLAGARLHEDVGSAHFVACALALVEPPGLLNAGPLLRLANAAQVPVLLCRAGTAAEIQPPGDRLPLGARADGAYQDAHVELRAGDVVVFTSDGLVEAPALPTAKVPAHLTPPEKPADLFGFARLSDSASHWSSHTPTAEDVAAGIWSDLTDWCGEQSHHDDMTLLVLRVLA